MELRVTIATNGGRPAKEMKPGRKNGSDGFRRKGSEHGVKRISASVIHADKILFAPERKQVEANMLHWVAQMRRWGRRDQRHEWLRK